MNQPVPAQNGDEQNEKGHLPLSSETDEGYHWGPKLKPGEEKPRGVNPDFPLDDPDADY